MAKETDRPHPLLTLNDGDREFVLRFVLASGSLKELAQVYQVSYPTIRAKLDRVIAQLHAALQERPPEPMADLLGNFVERGEISSTMARLILDLHHSEVKKTKEK